MEQGERASSFESRVTLPSADAAAKVVKDPTRLQRAQSRTEASAMNYLWLLNSTTSSSESARSNCTQIGLATT